MYYSYMEKSTAPQMISYMYELICGAALLTSPISMELHVIARCDPIVIVNRDKITDFATY